MRKFVIFYSPSVDARKLSSSYRMYSQTLMRCYSLTDFNQRRFLINCPSHLAPVGASVNGKPPKEQATWNLQVKNTPDYQDYSCGFSPDLKQSSKLQANWLQPLLHPSSFQTYYFRGSNRARVTNSRVLSKWQKKK